MIRISNYPGAANSAIALVLEIANYASAASQTEVPEGRYDNSPGQAKRRPGLRAQNDLLFFSSGLVSFGLAKPEGKKEAGCVREDIFKECIFVWIVPGDFNPSFPKLPPSMSMGVTNIFSSRGVRVYAHVDNYIADTNRWQQLVNEMSTPGRGGSIGQPDPRVSWKSWVEDITAALKK